MRDGFRPIVSERRVSRVAALFRPPAPEPGIALVLHQDGHELVVLQQTTQVFRRSEALRGVTRVYRVDLTAHRLRYVLAAPCTGDAVSFEVTAEVGCRVRDPRAVVEQRLVDAAAAMEPFVAGRVRTISRTHTYEEVGEAESRCAAALGTLVGVPLLEGALVVECTAVSLRIDDDVRRSLHRGEVLEARGRALRRCERWLGSLDGAASVGE